jgi:serine/threonine-protein kinase
LSSNVCPTCGTALGPTTDGCADETPHNPAPARSGPGGEWSAREQEPTVIQPLASRSPTLALPSHAGRYVILEEIARGGMGAILRVRDLELDRMLAVKIMLHGDSKHPELTQRFLEEARITGQLQHPGIAPVHEIGRLPDGRPFFSMKLIDGRALSDLLRERPTPQSELPRYLMIFEQIAQTMGYAHSRGVIHRDLKPSNVMVGVFGEVQVMDWGLAKRLDEGRVSEAGTSLSPDRDPATTGRSGGAGDVDPANDETMNWARDDSDRLTSTGQVLGTLMYMPPEQARGDVSGLDRRSDVFGLGAILCQVLTGEPPYRHRQRDELLRLASQGDLSDAAARLEACGADPELVRLTQRCLSPTPAGRPADAREVAEAVSHYLASVQERVAQERLERERQQVKATEERRRRKLWTSLAATVLIAACVAAAGGLYWQNQQAERRQELALSAQTLQQAEDRLRAGRFDEADALFLQAEGQLGSAPPADLKQQLNRLRASRDFVSALEQVREDRSTWTIDGFDYTSALRDYALVFSRNGLDVPGGDVIEVSRVIGESPVKAQLLAALDDWALVCHYRQNRVEDAEKKAELLRQRDRLLTVARTADPHPALRDALRDPVVWEDPEQLARLAGQLDFAEATPELLLLVGELLPRDTRVDLWRKGQEYFPNDFWLCFDLAYQLERSSPLDSAGYYRAALALRPNTAVVHNNLGVFFLHQGDGEQALNSLHRALSLQPDDARTVANIGNVLSMQEKWDEAIVEYRRALQLQPDLVLAHANLGLALLRKGDQPGALASLHEALRLDPDSASTHFHLGLALSRNRDAGQANQHFREAIRLDDGHTAAEAHRRLAASLNPRTDLDQIIDHLQQSLRIAPRDAGAHSALGAHLAMKRDWDAAFHHHREAIQLEPNMAALRYNAANDYKDKQDFEQAIRLYQTALVLDPTMADAHHNLAIALRNTGDLDGAIRHYHEALKIMPDMSDTHYNLGIALTTANRNAEAIVAFREALRIDPNDALAHRNLGVALEQNADLEGAIEHYRQAIQIDADYSRAYASLGAALIKQGDYPAALVNLKRAEELGSPSPRHLREAEHLIDLEGRLEEVLAGAEPNDVAERLGLGQICLSRKQYDRAVEFYEAAFEEDAGLVYQIQNQYRFRAARAAILASSGTGVDGDELDAERRADLRSQSLSWLQADLDAWAELALQLPYLKEGVARMLEEWRRDPALAAVRDDEPLSLLSSDEQESWKQLWSRHSALSAPAE